jgi:hypothetical protein
MGWKELAPLYGWVVWVSQKRNGNFQLLIFDSNFTGTPSRTIHKSEILPAQRQFIQQCRER